MFGGNQRPPRKSHCATTVISLGLTAPPAGPGRGSDGRTALLTFNRQLHTATAVVVTAVLAVGLACAGPAAAAVRDGATVAKSPGPAAKKAKQRARIRRALT